MTLLATIANLGIICFYLRQVHRIQYTLNPVTVV
jgi:hypothetical protein